MSGFGMPWNQTLSFSNIGHREKGGWNRGIAEKCHDTDECRDSGKVRNQYIR